MAKWFKYDINGSWTVQNKNNSKEKQFDSYIICEVKSKMDIVSLENIYLRFWNDSWVKVSINKNIKIEPNKINYLGTLSIDLHKTDQYSGNVINRVYSTNASGVQEGYVYNVDKKLLFIESDYTNDLKYLTLNYPEISNHFKNNVVYFKC